MQFRDLLLGIIACSLVTLGFRAVQGQVLDRSKIKILSRSVSFDSVDVISVDNSTGKVRFGPPLTDASSLVRLLADKEIADDIGLTQEQRLAINKVFGEERTSLQGLLDHSAVDSAVEKARTARRAAMDEVLLPSQLARLHQIVYRLEVSTLGFGRALAEGRLGEAAGIHENQRASLLKKSERIDSVRDNAVIKLRRDAEKRIIEYLPIKQQEMLNAMIGDFYFSEMAHLIKLKSAEASVEDPAHLFVLLKHSEIQAEIGLSKSAAKTINEYSAPPLEPKSASDRIKYLEMIKTAQKELLNNVLDKEDLRRLHQLAYRVEASAEGLVHEITAGQLKEKLSLTDSQQRSFLDEGSAIESKLAIDILAAYAKAEEQLLAELVPAQSKLVRELIGEVFMHTKRAQHMRAALERMPKRVGALEK